MKFPNKYLRNLKPYKLASHKIWAVKPEERPQVLKLDWNESTIPPSPLVRQRIEQCLTEPSFFNLYPTTYNEELLTLLSNYVGLPKENVQYFGSSDVLHEYICKAFISVGDPVMILGPSYDNFRLTCQANGADVYFSNYREDFTFDTEQFENDILTREPAVVYICNPNNPTGYLYTRREMNQIRDLVKKHNLYLFSDEVYREFIYTGSPYISSMHLEGIEQNVVLIDSVSKRYSECGIRIGALITKNEAIRGTVMKFCQARLSPPLIGQIVAEASIDGTEAYSREMYEEYVERRKCLIDGINRIPGCYTPLPMGAFYTVAKLPVDDAEKFCAWCLTDFSYEGETVMMAPAAGFYTTPGLGKDEVRMAYVLCKEDLKRALFILAKALEQYNSTK